MQLFAFLLCISLGRSTTNDEEAELMTLYGSMEEWGHLGESFRMWGIGTESKQGNERELQELLSW
jgi:hypothetical protein